MTGSSLKDRFLALVTEVPGLTDRELTDRLLSTNEPQQRVNQLARLLAAADLVTRTQRHDGLIGNYPYAAQTIALARHTRVMNKSSVRGPRALADSPTRALPTAAAPSALQRVEVEIWPAEDFLKRWLKDYLESEGWRVTVMWGRDRGVDVEAFKNHQRWLFEVKGRGSSQPANVNYFIGMLGETLQRMSDPNALYTIVMPDIPQFRGLWQRLPALAKERTAISAAFVSQGGTVEFS